jgi:hypothetical protein
MRTIREAELVDFIKNGAVQRLRIIETQNGTYQVVINLNWKEGDWNLVTAREHPREWASLDRLARHVRDKYQGVLPPISLTLNNKPSEMEFPHASRPPE